MPARASDRCVCSLKHVVACKRKCTICDRRCAIQHQSGRFLAVLQANDFVCMPTRVVARLVGPDATKQRGTNHERVAPILVSGGNVNGLNPFDRATLDVHRLGALVVPFADNNDAKGQIHDG